MSSSSHIVPLSPVSILVPIALVASFSSSSDLVSMISAIYVEMLAGLGTGGTIHFSSSEEVIRELVTYSIESSSYHTTCQNPSKLIEEISHS